MDFNGDAGFLKEFGAEESENNVSIYQKNILDGHVSTQDGKSAIEIRKIQMGIVKGN